MKGEGKRGQRVNKEREGKKREKREMRKQERNMKERRDKEQSEGEKEEKRELEWVKKKTEKKELREREREERERRPFCECLAGGLRGLVWTGWRLGPDPNRSLSFGDLGQRATDHVCTGLKALEPEVADPGLGERQALLPLSVRLPLFSSHSSHVLARADISAEQIYTGLST
ncbi:hypothetical protein WMY93_033389 [Mugilogobius chulae]|uniref:Uncharacterized protein n=1 Tax=Mugilogobius chulae TaxID=88201 RepID=A0AAW0MU14_9GOBI